MVTDGIYQSLSNGRYCTSAPIGYLNKKLTKDERKANKKAPIEIGAAKPKLTAYEKT